MKAFLAFVAAVALAVAAEAVPLLSPSPPPPTSSPWRIEAVGLFGGSAEPDLALDSHGIPHVLYCPPGDEEYATRNASGWTSEHVAFTIFGGGCGELAMGSGDVPHVTTLTSRGILKELYGTRAANGTWDLSPYPGGSLWAVNSRGEPQLFALWQLGPGVYAARYLTRMNGTWVHQDLETFSSPSALGEAWASLTLDEGESPHVLYYEDARGDVRYAFRDAAGWHVDVVEHIGNIQYRGRHGSLALSGEGAAYAAYWADVDYSQNRGSLRFATRNSTGWTVQTVEGPPGMKGRFPNIAVDGSGTVHVAAIDWDILNPSNYSFLANLQYATLIGGLWTWETVIAGYQFITGGDYHVRLPDFPSMAIDRCGNPHVAFYYNVVEGFNASLRGAYYATKGPPCLSPVRGVSLRVEPRTLNLKSEGQWVNARITVENATASDVDPASLALNGVPAARVEVADNTTLSAKFDRQALAATLHPGDDVVVTLTGHWKDGGTFTATDVIRVIDPGGGHGKAP